MKEFFKFAVEFLGFEGGFSGKRKNFTVRAVKIASLAVREKIYPERQAAGAPRDYGI